MAIEDLHWIDKSSEDYLKALLDSIAGARVFLIFTYRPEFVHTWGAKSYHSQVNSESAFQPGKPYHGEPPFGAEDIDK